MNEKIKLGLTRNRLFEFGNCVSFCGTLEKAFDANDLKKALKMLFIKYPLISSKTELTESNGEAYVVLDSVKPVINFSEGVCDIFISEKINNGIDFWNRNFEFHVLNGKTLCIFAHTAVADNYFLMVLASELMSFYSGEKLSVEEKPVCIFSELSSIPVKAFSPVTDKLTSELQLKWLKKPLSYGVEDYKKARSKYYDNEGNETYVKLILDAESVNRLKTFSGKNNIDLSSVVAFCYYDSLCKNNVGDKKHKKIYFHTNRRCVMSEATEYIQGAHNGLLEAFTESKKKSSSFNDRLKSFHKKVYKSFCSVSANFEKDFFLMNLSPAFCDSAYINRAGLNKNKASQKLSENHLCGVGEAGEFAFVNFSQAYWQDLRRFTDVVSSEPLKPRTLTFLQFDYNENGARFILKYRDKLISTEKAERVLCGLKENIENLIL